VAITPTIFIVCSDQHRNGKTLLARVLVDLLMLDNRDPFVIDVDPPLGPLRNHFPGRTALVDFATIPGQMKLFDTILAAPGRDYVIDLPATDSEHFFETALELGAFTEARRLGFRIFVMFVVDQVKASATIARNLNKLEEIDLLVPVFNAFIGSSWGEGEYALTLPLLDQDLIKAISTKRLSLRNFVLGDEEGLSPNQQSELGEFLVRVMSEIRDLEPMVSLKNIRR
jgi:hypothetical protein